ncbi:hypothetical protein BN132_3423 [Cronobacter turicensis 564]|nr:hypothetical protein BN132_3423 [Cronobacter turicensis 564]
MAQKKFTPPSATHHYQLTNHMIFKEFKSFYNENNWELKKKKFHP